MKKQNASKKNVIKLQWAHELSAVRGGLMDQDPHESDGSSGSLGGSLGDSAGGGGGSLGGSLAGQL